MPTTSSLGIELIVNGCDSSLLKRVHFDRIVLQECHYNIFLKEIGLDGYDNLILCHNCLSYIKRNTIPSINEQNGLFLDDVPDELKLTDLEQQLIAKSLLFIKISIGKKYSFSLLSVQTLSSLPVAPRGPGPNFFHRQSMN